MPTIEDQIKNMRSAGASDMQISNYYATKMRDKLVDDQQINQWLNQKGLPPSGASRPISTVTGKPIPTGPEQWEMSKSVIKKAGPIAGDIAFTLATPQGKVQAASRLGRMGMRGLNALMRGGMAGAGGAAGSMAADVAVGDPIDIQRATGEAAAGGLGELFLSAVGGPIKYISKPIREAISDYSFSGSFLKKNLREKFIKRGTQRGEKFLEDVAPDVIPKEKMTFANLSELVGQAKDQTDMLYNTFESTFRKGVEESGGVAKLPNTMAYIENLRDKLPEGLSRVAKNNKIRMQLGFKKMSDFDVVLEAMKPTGKKGYLREGLEGVDPKVVEGLFANVFKGYRKFPGEQTRIMREELKNAMIKDMEQYVADTGKSVAELKKLADQQWNALRKFKLLKGVYDSASTKDLTTGLVDLKPGVLANKLEEAIVKYKKDFPDELILKLKKEVAYYRELSEQIGKQERRQGFMGQLPVRMAGTGAIMATSGPVPAAGFELLGLVSAYTLMDEAAQKAFSNFIKSSAKAGIHLGAGLFEQPKAMGMGKIPQSMRLPKGTAPQPTAPANVPMLPGTMPANMPLR